MKNSLVGLLVLAIGLLSCSSQKKLEAQTPFVLGSTFSEEWVGDRAGDSSGHTVKIEVAKITGEDVSLQSLYFRGQMAKVSMEEEDGDMFATARFEKQKTEKPDIIMHADPKKEIGNQPPKLKKNNEKPFPFELKDNEAVLSYLDKGKVKYAKISGIKG